MNHQVYNFFLFYSLFIFFLHHCHFHYLEQTCTTLCLVLITLSLFFALTFELVFFLTIATINMHLWQIKIVLILFPPCSKIYNVPLAIQLDMTIIYNLVPTNLYKTVPPITSQHKILGLIKEVSLLFWIISCTLFTLNILQVIFFFSNNLKCSYKLRINSIFSMKYLVVTQIHINFFHLESLKYLHWYH